MIVWWLDLQLALQSMTPVSSTSKTDRHDITEILLKVALSTIPPPPLILGRLYKCRSCTTLLPRVYISDYNKSSSFTALVGI